MLFASQTLPGSGILFPAKAPDYVHNSRGGGFGYSEHDRICGLITVKPCALARAMAQESYWGGSGSPAGGIHIASQINPFLSLR